jgi:GH24 family phage-related lysozyme (muramidase)
LEDDPTDDGRELSAAALLQALRGLRAGSAIPADPMASLQAALADDARRPRGGGLIGSGYAAYMADHAPPEGCFGVSPSGPSPWPAWPAAPSLFPPFNSAPSADASASAPDPGGTGGAAPNNPEIAVQPPRPAVPQPDSSPTSGIAPGQTGASVRGLTTSPQGRDFIQRLELDDAGRPYFDITPDARHNPTFGYGHKVEADEDAALRAKLNGLDREGRAKLIDSMFEDDLATAEQRVKDRLGPDAVGSLTQHQFDALVADAFNAGSGGALGPKMLQSIWDGDMDAAGKQFNSVWGRDEKTGQRDIMGGLVTRSLREAAIFNRGDYAYMPTKAEQEALKQSARAAAQAKAKPPR